MKMRRLLVMVMVLALLAPSMLYAQGIIHPVVGNAVKVEHDEFSADWDGDRDAASKDALYDAIAKQNLSITKADPAIILKPATSGDTSFWFGVQDDAGSDDDDTFQIGDGATPGTNPFVYINTSGYVGIGKSPEAPLQVGTNTATSSYNPSILISRQITTDNNAHGFVDYNTFNVNNNRGYASFDAYAQIGGTSYNYDHVNCFQGRIRHGTTGTTGEVASFASSPTVTYGTITVLKDVKINDWTNPYASGAVGTHYGIYIANLTNATTNYAIYTDNNTPSHFGGKIDIAPGTTGGLYFDAAEATANITANHTITIQTNVPSGAKLLGCQLRVDAALATGETWNAAYVTGSTQSIASAQAVAKNTKVNKFFDENAATAIASDEVDIAIQRNSNPGVDVFTAQGTIRAIVYYQGFTAMANAT